MDPMLATLEVSQPERSREVRELQSSNMRRMSVTLDESQEERSALTSVDSAPVSWILGQ